jgi:hypothetical protein
MKEAIELLKERIADEDVQLEGANVCLSALRHIAPELFEEEIVGV